MRTSQTRLGRFVRAKVAILIAIATAGLAAAPAEAATTTATYVPSIWAAAVDGSVSGSVPPQKVFAFCNAQTHQMSVSMSTFNYGGSAPLNAVHHVEWQVWARVKGTLTWTYINAGATDYNGFASLNDPNYGYALGPMLFNHEAQVIGWADYGIADGGHPGSVINGVPRKFHELAIGVQYSVNGRLIGSAFAYPTRYSQLLSWSYGATDSSTCGL